MAKRMLRHDIEKGTTVIPVTMVTPSSSDSLSTVAEPETVMLGVPGIGSSPVYAAPAMQAQNTNATYKSSRAVVLEQGMNASQENGALGEPGLFNPYVQLVQIQS